MSRSFATFLAAVALAAGCGGNDAPTSPSSVAVAGQVSELFVGTLPAQGTRFYSYEVLSPGGTTSITLASLGAEGSRAASTARVSLGVGTPAGEGCAVSQSVTTAAGLTAQLALSQTAGIYCASIADIGELTTSLNFAIRIVHP